MRMRRCAGPALAVAGLLALAGAGPAGAQGSRTFEPLNQYVVTGKVNPEDLARKGFDMTEAQVKGKAGFAIVATPSQAADLAGKDVTVRPLGGEARTASVVPPNPLTDPTHGYDVFRPWSLKPAPCPTTCATPLVPLKDFYADLARRNPDVVKSYVIGKSVLGQDIVAYKVTRTRPPSATAAARPSSTTPRSTRASGSRPRSSAGSSSTSSRTRGRPAASRSGSS
jgi:hypothetical protein